MASAAEQLAANLSWQNFGRAKDLQSRIFYTFLLLVVFRVGAVIPVPGIDGRALQGFFDDFGAGFGDMLNMFTGGALQQAAIFSLGIMPYISASIIIQLLTAVLPSLENLKKEGEPGRKKINQYTRYLTVILATVQAYAWSNALQAQEGVVVDPGLTFIVGAVVTWVGGTMFLMWLGEQITARGIGNGVSLIIFVGIISGLPGGIGRFFEASRTEGTNFFAMILIIAVIIGLITFIVFVERAMRKVVVQYQRRQVGNKVYGGDSSHLPIKLNPSGVIPAIFATSVLVLPVTFATARLQGGETGIMGTVMAYIGNGQPLFYVLFAFLIVFFAYFYTLNVAFKVDDVADNLKKQGGFVPGVRPGARTAEYLEYVTRRILVAGSIYLVIVTVFPSFLQEAFSVPVVLQGTSLLIVVSVTMDTVSQIQSHLLAYQYEGLLEKSKLRGKDRAKARRKAPKARKPRK